MSSDTPRTDAQIQEHDYAGDGFYISVDFARTLERELTALRKEREWRPIETADKYSGRIICVFDPDLVNEDFNPDGTTEAYWQDDEGWKAPVWCDCNDEWETKVINPTHWLPLPDTQAITGGEGTVIMDPKNDHLWPGGEG